MLRLYEPYPHPGHNSQVARSGSAVPPPPASTLSSRESGFLKTAVDKYARAYQRWTWDGQRNEDGIKILSPIKKHFKRGCMFFSVAATMEANLRVAGKNNVILSPEHRKNLYELSLPSLEECRGMERLLRVLCYHGAMEEADYNSLQQGYHSSSAKHMIKSFSSYTVSNADQLRDYLKILIKKGPTLAVFKINKNYEECLRSGHVYRYNSQSAVLDENSNVNTHAVCVIGFCIEEGIPGLVCRDSQGSKVSRKGILVVDVTSILELYSLVI